MGLMNSMIKAHMPRLFKLSYFLPTTSPKENTKLMTSALVIDGAKSQRYVKNASGKTIIKNFNHFFVLSLFKIKENMLTSIAMCIPLTAKRCDIPLSRYALSMPGETWVLSPNMTQVIKPAISSLQTEVR